jgi:hypothetical protein
VSRAPPTVKDKAMMITSIDWFEKEAAACSSGSVLGSESVKESPIPPTRIVK